MEQHPKSGYLEEQESMVRSTKVRNNFTVVYERRVKSLYGSIEKFVKYQEKSTGVTKTKTLENEDLRPKTRLSFRDYEN